MTRKEVRAKVAEYIAAHPELSYKRIGETLGCATSTVATIAFEYGVVRQRKALTEADLAQLEEPVQYTLARTNEDA